MGAVYFDTCLRAPPSRKVFASRNNALVRKSRFNGEMMFCLDQALVVVSYSELVFMICRKCTHIICTLNYGLG